MSLCINVVGSRKKVISLIKVAKNILIYLYLLESTDHASVTTSESTKLVPEGSNVDIVCQLDGNPSPNVTWTDQTTGQVVQTQTSQSAETRLTINNANCLNTTTYRVAAANRRGSENIDIVLNVTCKICSRLNNDMFVKLSFSWITTISIEKNIL